MKKQARATAYNAPVFWMALKTDWNRRKLQKRCFFLEEVDKASIRPQVSPRIAPTETNIFLVRRVAGAYAS